MCIIEIINKKNLMKEYLEKRNKLSYQLEVTYNKKMEMENIFKNTWKKFYTLTYNMIYLPPC
jgi:hypothetical protein